MKKVVIITGPTAVGKTDISIKLAKYYNAEIINADASQFRKHLNIGTAKITKEEMDGVKHHLIDIIEPTEDFSIKDFQEQGRSLINQIDRPFVVGGSGLYINALIQDYNLEAKSRDESVFDDLSNDELHEMLASLDKVASEKIHKNNRRRVIRYIELIKEQGSVVVKEPVFIYDVLVITLSRDREVLYDRINKRFDKMIDDGFLDECISLKNQNIDLSKIKDIGYKEAGLYLNHQISFDEFKEMVKQNTRHLAKKQLTWFRNKLNCVLIDLDKISFEEILEIINNFYKN